MIKQKLQLLDLPTEILLHILTPFATDSLLQLTPLCRPVHNLILRILHYRLLLAAKDPSYRLILDAYHPSRRWDLPYLFCTYLGTDGLSSTHEGVGLLYNDDVCESPGTLGKFGKLYSSFRPEFPDVEGSIPARRIAGAPPVLSQSQNVNALNPNTNGAGSAGDVRTPVYGNTGDGGLRKIVYTINLDEGELFGQFCVYSQLVSGWRRRGIFDSTVNVVKPGQGTIRIWRQWLLERCNDYTPHGLIVGVEKGVEVDMLERTSTTRCPTVGGDPSILWTDPKKNVGLKVEVRHRNPAAYRKTMEQLDDDALSCELVVQELVVRTTHLMLAVEEATAVLQSNQSGKTLIFGNFASRVDASSG